MIADTPLTQAVASAASCAHLVRRLLAQEGAMPAAVFLIKLGKTMDRFGDDCLWVA